MSSLLVQIFVILLGAFLLGVLIAWRVRRRTRIKLEYQPTVAAAPAPQPAEGAARFERALSGNPSPAPTRGAPVVEVQPRPAPAPQPQPAPAPAPAQVAPRPSRFGTPTTSAPAAPPEIVKPSEPAPIQPSTAPIQSSRFAARVASAAAPSASAAPAPAPAAPAATAASPPAPAQPMQNPPPPSREIPGMSLATAAAVAASTGAGGAIAGDDLTRIRSIDAETSQRLRAIGVFRYSDVAAWTEGDISRVSQALGTVGRIERENWIEQAAILTKGGGVPVRPAASAPAASAHPAPAGGSADRLHRILGIDAATEKLLIENRVTRFADIAAWSWADIERIEALLGKPGRVGLENWIEQARILARGGGNNVTPLRPAEPTQEAAAAPASARPQQPAPQSRTDIAGLRSVRSEALRREPLSPFSAINAFDDLKRIRGVGVRIEKKLNSAGVTSYEQIANWTGADIERIDRMLDFKGQIVRENWVEQARILASGGYTEFARRADRGEIERRRNRTG